MYHLAVTELRTVAERFPVSDRLWVLQCHSVLLLLSHYLRMTKLSAAPLQALNIYFYQVQANKL